MLDSIQYTSELMLFYHQNSEREKILCLYMVYDIKFCVNTRFLKLNMQTIFFFFDKTNTIINIDKSTYSSVVVRKNITLTKQFS